MPLLLRSNSTGPLVRTARLWSLALGIALGLWAWTLAAPGASANGSAVTEVYKGQDGAYRITVRAASPRLVRGNAHLSVVLLDAQTQRLVTNASVSFLGRGPDGSEVGPLPAYRSVTTPQYYDVNMTVGALGTWMFTVQVTGQQGPGAFSFPLEVDEPVVNWAIVGGLLALVLLGLPLALVGMRAFRRTKGKANA
ncbi:MAG: hypothetical protein HY681_13350 [Chloroflexi bacterium]|nr:hypothetical protein [Chloroflexota bacterium]